MNIVDAYLVNTGPNDYQQWQPAHWDRPGDVTRFHWMKLDESGQRVLLHDSCIKRVKVDTKALEDEMSRLLEHKGLTPEARKLITAALQAQATGKSEFSI